MIYVHETYDVKPGRYRDFARNVEQQFLPIAERHQLRLVAFWETVFSQGEPPEAIALWELDDWAHLGSLNEAQYPSQSGGDKKLQDWNEGIWEWIDKRRGKVLIPGPSSPSLAQLKDSGVSAKICVHETLKVVPNLQDAYLEAVDLQYYPLAHKYARREMIGYYKTFWRNCENINIWSLMDGWSTLGFFDGRSSSGAQQQREGKHWMNAALGLRTDWEERLLYAAPFSPL